MARLCINIESVAILRKHADIQSVDPVTVAILAELGGVDGLVCPLTEELPYVNKRDLKLLRDMTQTHININVPPSEPVINEALTARPDMVTLVPGKKPGTTSGGGLDVLGHEGKFGKIVHDLRNQEVIVSLCVDPNIHQVKAAAKLGADYVELHMGDYARSESLKQKSDQLENIQSIALAAHKLGLGVSAGRCLNYQNVMPISGIPQIEEINIGRAIINRALSIGIEAAVRDMAALVH